ncbi:MAG: pilus assembly protein [Streptosporangiales bacterium]|nr:pilus assembly protein [Streptosporangiales bacterium]
MNARADARGDRGAAVVEFALVSILLTVLVLGVLQVGLALYVRNTLVACASAGARYGANANRTPADGAAYTERLVARSLADRYAVDVTGGVEVRDGAEVVVVEVDAPLPVVGLIGPVGGITVRGHALREGVGP